MALLNCATTARPNPAAGSSRVVSPKRAIRWPAETQRTRASRASLHTGLGHGRTTVGFFTIAPAPTLLATLGTQLSRSLYGTAVSGPESTCQTMGRPQ